LSQMEDEPGGKSVIATDTFGKKCCNHAIKKMGFHFIDLTTSFD
jgi:hypothetical protein